MCFDLLCRGVLCSDILRGSTLNTSRSVLLLLSTALPRLLLGGRSLISRRLSRHRSINRGSLDCGNLGCGSVGYGSLDSGRILLRGSGQGGCGLAIHAIALDSKAAIDHAHSTLLILRHSTHTVGGAGLECRARNLHLGSESTGGINLRDISRSNHAAGCHTVFVDGTDHQVHCADTSEALATQGQGLS